MRVTNALIQGSLRQRINLAQARLLRLEEQAASGRRVTRPDDDPTSAAIARRLDSALADLASYEPTSRQARSRLETADGVLGSVFNQLVRLREITLAMSNGSMTDEQRAMAGEEAEQIRVTAVNLANTKLEDTYLFGGLDTDTAPFLDDGTFVGSGVVPEVEISPGVTIESAPKGEEIFTAAAGGIDVMQVMEDVGDALMAGDEDRLRGLLSRIDVAEDQIRLARSALGPSINRIAAAEEIRETLRLELIERRSAEVDADLPETLSQMALSSQALEASLAVTARALSHTILDKLR